MRNGASCKRKPRIKEKARGKGRRKEGKKRSGKG